MEILQREETLIRNSFHSGVNHAAISAGTYIEIIPDSYVRIHPHRAKNCERSHHLYSDHNSFFFKNQLLQEGIFQRL
jgi:hypothetical protein